jgi:hypothetical protein
VSTRGYQGNVVGADKDEHYSRVHECLPVHRRTWSVSPSRDLQVINCKRYDDSSSESWTS